MFGFLKSRILFHFAVDFIQHPQHRRFFGFVDDDSGMMVCRVHAVIGQNVVDIVILPTTSHHHVEIPVIERQTIGHSPCGHPGFTARNHRGGAYVIPLKDVNELVSLVILTA